MPRKCSPRCLDISRESCIRCAPMYRRLLFAMLLGIVAGCASKPTLRVSAERSAAADFSGYRTYRWRRPLPEAVPGHPRYGRDLMDWRIRNVVETQLNAKGYTEVSSRQADLVVDCYVGIKEKHTDSVNDFIHYRESGGDEGPQESYVYGYQEGTIIVEVYDATTNHLVWRGSAAPVINPETQQDKVREAVLSVIQRFPTR